MTNDLQTLEAINRATLQNIAANGGNSRKDEYYGFVTVDIFDCPPFLMFTNNDCPRCSEVLFLRSFEPGSMKIWCALARNATAILDIGAQVGVYALAAAALRSDIPIHAFEPNPYAFTRLRINRQVNRFKNVIDHALAVGNQTGIIELTWRARPEESIASGATVGTVVSGVATDSCFTRVGRLDDIVQDDLGARGLIKIDVEAAEVLVFAGMPRALMNKPDIIVETFAEPFCDEINRIIAPLGYSVYAIDEAARTLTRQEKLMPADMGGNCNQLLTVRPLDPPLAAMLRA